MPKSRVHTERTCGESCRTSRSGFTLIELLIAISIIAILSAIGFTMYSVAMKQGRDSKRQSDLRTIQSALEQYYSDQGFYPYKMAMWGGGYGLDELLEAPSRGAFTSEIGIYNFPVPSAKTYINSLPQDPSGTTRYIYEAIPTSVSGGLPCSNESPAAYKCTSYCLYAKLENPPSPAMTPPAGCTFPPGYTFFLTPP